VSEPLARHRIHFSDPNNCLNVMTIVMVTATPQIAAQKYEIQNHETAELFEALRNEMNTCKLWRLTQMGG
jgi:hypothetical protein